MKTKMIASVMAAALMVPAAALAGHHKMDMGQHEMKGIHTMPSDGAVVNTSPSEIHIHFGHEMTVERVVVTTLLGEIIELDVSDIAPAEMVVVPAPALEPGDYTVDWRAVGDGDHAMTGTFTFTIDPAAEETGMDMHKAHDKHESDSEGEMNHEMHDGH